MFFNSQSYYGEEWASLMHRELLQWMSDLKEGDLSSDVLVGDNTGVPPTDEDWVSIKPVLPSVTNLHEVVPSWATGGGSEQTTSPSQEMEPPCRTEQTWTDIASEDAGTVSSQEGGVDDQDRAADDEDEERADTVQAGPEGTSAVQSASALTTPSRQTMTFDWNKMDNLKRRLTYDILPKVQ